MTDIIVYVVNALADILNDYPLTIIAVTLLIKFVLLPFDIHQRKNSRKQMALTAEVADIRRRYKDPNQANQKVQELYRKHKVSTLAGCLPLALQLVFLFSFFSALRMLVAEQTSLFVIEASALGADAVELPKWLWINNFWQPDSGFVSPMANAEELLTFLNQNVRDLSPEHLMLMKQSGIIEFTSEGLNVVESVYMQLHDSVLAANGLTGIANGWFGLPIITGVTTFLQQKLSMKNQPKMDEQTEATNNTMTYFMPFFSAAMCLSSNSGFALYWAVSNIITIVFTFIINAVFDAKEKKAAKAAL